MTQQDLTACITTHDLAALFDNAFARWRQGHPDKDPRRRTPRIPVGNARPLFVASFNARHVPLNCQARIVDVSADGLGVVLSQPVPAGATIHVLMADENGRPTSSLATVVRAYPCEGGYRAGLCFNETSNSLDADASSPSRLYHAGVWLKRVYASVCAKCTNGQAAARHVDRTVDGCRAELVVESRLFRYTATLFVNGRKVAARTGLLRDRLRNLLFDSGLPTAVTLTGGGFSAWAMLHPNLVVDCGIEPAIRSTRARRAEAEPALLRAS